MLIWRVKYAKVQDYYINGPEYEDYVLTDSNKDSLKDVKDVILESKIVQEHDYRDVGEWTIIEAAFLGESIGHVVPGALPAHAPQS